ncbi:MAG: CvpA family protein [Clostridia bacterium]|nr:CvpA family protein [Clostridia bacterium]
MAVIDIIVIAVLVIFGAIGAYRGFLNTIISLFGNLGSLALAIFCAKPVAGFLDKIFGVISGIGTKISNGLAETIAPLNETLTTINGAGLKEYLKEGGLTFQERLMSLFIEDGVTFATNAEITTYLGERIAAIAALVIAGVLMFIIIRIAVILLARLFDALTKNAAIGGLDRTVGMFVGLLKAALIISVVLGVFYLIANTTVNGWIEGSVITKWLYQHVCELVDWAVTQFNLP